MPGADPVAWNDHRLRAGGGVVGVVAGGVTDVGGDDVAGRVEHHGGRAAGATCGRGRPPGRSGSSTLAEFGLVCGVTPVWAAL